jgi:hypothetical protein
MGHVCGALAQLHLPEHEEKLREYKQHVSDALAKMQTKGIVFLVIQHLWLIYRDKMRREHDWLGVMVPTLDSQVCVLVSV